MITHLWAAYIRVPRIMTLSAGTGLGPTQPLVPRIMSDLAFAAVVDHSQTATTLLELHLAGRLVQPVELAGGVGASDELLGQLHIHPVIQGQGEPWHPQVLIKAVLDEEVDEGALAGRSGGFSRHVCRLIHAGRYCPIREASSKLFSRFVRSCADDAVETASDTTESIMKSLPRANRST